jgi:hypothetical protein
VFGEVAVDLQIDRQRLQIQEEETPLPKSSVKAAAAH